MKFRNVMCFVDIDWKTLCLLIKLFVSPSSQFNEATPHFNWTCLNFRILSSFRCIIRYKHPKNHLVLLNYCSAAPHVDLRSQSMELECQLVSLRLNSEHQKSAKKYLGKIVKATEESKLFKNC